MIKTKTDKYGKLCVFIKIRGLTIRLNYGHWLGMFKCRKVVVLMSEQKRKIGFTVACVNEFANRHKLSSKEAFQYLFRFKGIAFIKENYDVEHTLDFDTILDDLGILCKKNGGTL